SRRGLAPSLRRADARTRRRAPTVSDTATPRRGTAIGPTARSAAGDAVDVEDAFDLAHGREHGGQMAGIAHLAHELRRCYPRPRGANGRGADIHMGVSERLRDIGEQPGPVAGFDLDLDEIDSAGLLPPFDLDHAFGFAFEGGDVRAVDAVDGHSRTAGDEAEDLVSGNRGAAAGEFDEHIVDAFDGHALGRGVMAGGLAG